MQANESYPAGSVNHAATLPRPPCKSLWKAGE